MSAKGSRPLLRFARFVPVLIAGSLAGCASSSPRPATVPDAAWMAAGDSPRSSAPMTRVRASRSQRPTPPGQPLTREQVLQLATLKDPQDAIAEIDRHPLSFALDNASLAWFEDRVVPPEVADYLRKRAQVDWSQVRGDALADAPPPSRDDQPPQPAPPTDSWADAPPPQSPPVEQPAMDDPGTTVVYDDQPTYVVGGVVYSGWGWYDGAYWRPWRPWYHRDSFVGTTVYSGAGYGSAPGNYRSGGYGNYPYARGSFVYAQPRGFVAPPTITRPPGVNRSTGRSGGTTGRSSSAGHHR